MALTECIHAHKILRVIVALFLLGSIAAHARESKWLKAPKPKFPKEALKEFVEGSVTIRANLTPDGRVAAAKIAKTSGDARLDGAAVEAVLKWKMDPAAITASDLKEGRSVVFDFKQEAMLGAVYHDRSAYFTGKSATFWVFAPFPAYPEHMRRQRREGTVRLAVMIGPQGLVSNVEVLESSGHPALDNAAVTAVRHWRARRQHEGTKIRFPVQFTLPRR